MWYNNVAIHALLQRTRGSGERSDIMPVYTCVRSASGVSSSFTAGVGTKVILFGKTEKEDMGVPQLAVRVVSI